MNFLRNLIQGPAAASGLGGAPPDSEGHPETVITRENTGGTTPPLSPASTHSDASVPGLSQECDAASLGDDTTTTTTTSPCVTCPSDPPSSHSEAPGPRTGKRDSSANSDSEYESAEELDAAHTSHQEALQAPSSPQSPKDETATSEELVTRESPNKPLENHSDPLTETSFSVANGPTESDKNDPDVTVNGVGSVATETTPVTCSETTPNVIPENIPHDVTSEQPVGTVCESVLTVTRNEVAEESLVENTVLIDQQVIAATHTTLNSSTSHEPSDPVVDVSDINLVTIGSDDRIGNSEVEVEPYVPVSLDAKDTSDFSGESERVCETQVTGQVTDEPSVPEVASQLDDTLRLPSEEQTPIPRPEGEEAVPEIHEVSQDAIATTSSSITEEPIVSSVKEESADTPKSTAEENVPVPHQETGIVQEQQELNQNPTGTLESVYTEEQKTEDTTTATTEDRAASPPLKPPPDPDDIPIAPRKAYNLDFLDNLDDPNFNPFASQTALRNTPPPSPEADRKLPPLKPAVKKKSKKPTQEGTEETSVTNTPIKSGNEEAVEKSVQADTQESGGGTSASVPPEGITKESQEQEEESDQKGTSSVLEISFDDGDSPSKAPVKLRRKPPQRRPVRKTQDKPRVTEKNNNVVEKQDETRVEREEEDLPIPPSKGYNLDFLDNLDDPNFNPFASKTAGIRNSPPTSDGAFPASRTSNEEAEQPKAKVVVAKKPSPKKGFNVPKENGEIVSDSKPGEVTPPVPVTQAEEKQDSTQVSETCEAEPASDTEAKHKEENQEEEEQPLPKKGYNLDFLDDPNFDPFQSRSPFNPGKSDAKGAAGVEGGESAVIRDASANDVAGNDEVDGVVNREDVASEEAAPEHPESKPEKEPSECVDEGVAEPELSQEVNSSTPKHEEEHKLPEPTERQINQVDALPESPITKDTNQTPNQKQDFPSLTDSENNWSEESAKTPSLGTIGQLDSLEFDQLLEHEASRLAEEFMNCSRNSGLSDYDQSPDNNNPDMADTSYSNIRQVDENVNPLHRGSDMANSPPLGKRGAVCGAESTDSPGLPFSARRAFKRDIVVGEERLDTSSLEDDSGIVVGSRSDLETEVNHSEAGPEIATGLTSSDLRCASQCNSDDLDEEEEFSDQITDEEFLSSETFFREATDIDNLHRRSLVSPLLGCHSKVSGDVTPTKDKKEPPAGAPESPQNKPTPSTSSSPAPPPPREERSAPEGTSSPSPRPNDTAERKSLSTRPTSAPPEGYMTASEVQELLKRQELKFEEKLLRVELAAGEKEKKLQQTMKDEQKELVNLGSSVSELTQSRDALLKMVTQYKGMLGTLVADKEKEKKASDEKISSLQGERDQALEDLANVEVAFSDVHRKYERTKQVVDTLKRNEETLRGAVADYEAKLKKQEQKFLEFQKHAEEKIQMANEEFESMRKSNEQEMTKMAALLKKAEMKIMSLQDSFDRKTRENQELTQLCDDLINKVGTSH